MQPTCVIRFKMDALVNELPQVMSEKHSDMQFNSDFSSLQSVEY